MAHTPGPWTLGSEGWGRKGAFGTPSQRFKRVRSKDCEVARVWCSDDDSTPSPDLMLIAAAPELLAALRQIVEDVGDGFNCDPDAETLAQCWLAINKAEGRYE